MMLVRGFPSLFFFKDADTAKNRDFSGKGAPPECYAMMSLGKGAPSECYAMMGMHEVHVCCMNVWEYITCHRLG